jgi:hypothetical protein
MEILFARKVNLVNIRHSVFGLIYISLSMGIDDSPARVIWMDKPPEENVVTEFKNALGELLGI